MTCPHGTDVTTVCRVCWETGLQGQRRPNEAEAVKRERAAVVRYLRRPDWPDIWDDDAHVALNVAADAIERGEHLKEPL